MAYAFDTLGYAKRIEAAGVDREKAEAHAEAVRDFVMVELVTRADLIDAKRELRDALEHQALQLMVRLGGLVAVVGGIIITVLGFIIRTH